MQLPIVFLLVMTRVLCVVMTAPILGSRTIPLKFRVLIAGIIATAAMPLATAHNVVPTEPGQIMTAVLSEVVIGIMLGLGVAIMFAAAQAAGSVLGQLAGIQWPSQIDIESGAGVSPVGQLFGMISLAAFALIGGPELVVSSMLETCIHLPLGASLESTGIIALLTGLLQQSFLLTLRGVGPAVAALLISTIVMALISRTYPQMNMLGIGLNSNQFVLFLAVFLTLGGSVWLFVDDLGEVVVMIQSTLQGLYVESQSEVVGQIQINPSQIDSFQVSPLEVR